MAVPQRENLSKLPLNIYSLFAILLALRIISALTVRTFFQPDEYFQSLEPAWLKAFGPSSGAWITWEWREHLRSSLHPLLFSGVYKIAVRIAALLNVSPSTRADILIAAPKVMQAFFAATTDLFTYRLACRTYATHSQAALAALALTVLSPWQWFCSVRTLSNSLETTLTIFALELWQWEWFLKDEKPKAATNGKAEISTNSGFQNSPMPTFMHASLSAAAVACILRPTNLIVWATVGIACLWQSRNAFSKATELGVAALLNGFLVLIQTIYMDRGFYGKWVFPPLKFVHFNVVQSLAVFYGRNRADYYLTEGLPLLLTTALPFAVVGMWQALWLNINEASGGTLLERRLRFVLASAVITSVLILSLISHKEVRFIYPLLPMLHVLAAKPAAAFYRWCTTAGKRYRIALIGLGVAINFLIAGYTGYVHQRGVMDVMHYLRHEHEHRQTSNGAVEGTPVELHDRMTVGFLMPCHSTPWRSHLVYPEIDAWALTCEPPLNITLAERDTYFDEADMFYAGPEEWVRQNMKDVDSPTTSTSLSEETAVDSRRDWPEYLAFFEQLEPTMRSLLTEIQYRQCWRGFNAHWHDDWRRRGDVIVWCRRKS